MRTSSGLKLKQQHGEWFRTFNWRWFATFTFSTHRSPAEASALLASYFEEVEREVHAPLSCLIAPEYEKFSGVGKPSVRIHFHTLIACTGLLQADRLRDLWQQKRFGGDQTKGPSAYIVPYDPKQDAASYCFKQLPDPSWDWSCRHLELVCPQRPESYHTSARTRRTLRRHADRMRN